MQSWSSSLGKVVFFSCRLVLLPRFWSEFGGSDGLGNPFSSRVWELFKMRNVNLWVNTLEFSSTWIGQEHLIRPFPRGLKRVFELVSFPVHGVPGFEAVRTSLVSRECTVEGIFKRSVLCCRVLINSLQWYGGSPLTSTGYTAFHLGA